ncbi:MAG: hypothetical protein RLZZ563_1008 [Pseudomonadota bacterium]
MVNIVPAPLNHLPGHPFHGIDKDKPGVGVLSVRHLVLLAGASALALMTSQASAEGLPPPSDVVLQGTTPAKATDSPNPNRFTLRFGALLSRVGDFGGARINSLAGDVRIDEHLVAGASYERARQGQTDLGFASDTTFSAVSAYLGSNRDKDEGLIWTLAYTVRQGTVGTYRFPGVVGAEMGYGTATMSSHRASVELGYGLRPNDSLLVTPLFRLSHSKITRAAYTEDATIAFPLSYDAANFDRTTATLGLDLAIIAGATTVISMGAGVDHDLNASPDILTGTSAIPGFATFATAATGPVDTTRLYASASLRRSFAGGSSILVSGRIAEDATSASTYKTLGVTYEISF